MIDPSLAVNPVALLFKIAALHIAVSFVVNRMSWHSLAAVRLHLTPRKWEKNGEIYQKLFRIRSWKEYIPVAGPFDKRSIRSDEVSYISIFILETVRAELAHWLCLVATVYALISFNEQFYSSILFFFLAINLPCIMIQRYNRPRLERVLRMKKSPLIIPAESRGRLFFRKRYN